jgi:hypothetical protein
VTDPDIECGRWLWIVALVLAIIALAVYVAML